MTEIPEEAIEKAAMLANAEDGCDFGWCANQVNATGIGQAFSRYIADVSEKAKEARLAFATMGVFYSRVPVHVEKMQRAASEGLVELILPNPEADLLKEAREICARLREKADFSDARNYLEGIYDDTYPMRCTLAALRKGN